MAYEKPKSKPLSKLAADRLAGAFVGRARTDAENDIVQAWVAKVDQVAHQMERIWGVDRLPGLVSADYAQRFYSQARKFNHAVYHGTAADVEAEGTRMQNAWLALNDQAIEMGAKPLDAEWWEVKLPNGKLIAVTRSFTERRLVEQAVQGRQMQVWALEELLNLFTHMEAELKIVANVKNHFDGAKVVDVRTRTTSDPASMDPNDMIPF